MFKRKEIKEDNENYAELEEYDRINHTNLMFTLNRTTQKSGFICFFLFRQWSFPNSRKWIINL